MARLFRFVIPGQPQHFIQRRNNRQVTFAAAADNQFFDPVTFIVGAFPASYPMKFNSGSSAEFVRGFC